MKSHIMNGKESKRKARRKLYPAPTSSVPSSVPLWPSSTSFNGTPPTPFQPFGNGVITMNVNDVATEFGLTMKSDNTDAERITELMDAPDAPLDLEIAAHAISRGPNPYLDRCMHCNALRPDNQEGDEGLELLDLQLDGNTVISSGGENSQPFSSFKLEIWTCADCRKVAGSNHFWENCERAEVQDNWVELRSIVRDLYASEEEPVLVPEQEKRLKFLIDRLCRTDPHQLFLGLEAQVREIVSDIKTSLLAKLRENGCDKPELALDFTSSLLSHYDLLTKKAHLLAQYLGGLSSHLKRFEVTWELLNKHLFHSIAHNDPAISSSGPTILEQLRQGSVQYEKSKDDPFCAVRKRLLKFQEEMSVVVVVWRDCQQLIENYCHEEVKNTHKHVSSKTRSFISQQRQLLKDHLLREPYSGEALSETMKNLMARHKASRERVMCHRCKRERCTCDECTITHRITCGIINSDISGDNPPNAFNFALDRNVIDITPPSMSSTTSSSGSVSPINIEDKLTTFYDHSTEEFNDALLNCEDREGNPPSMNGDSNFDNCEDEEADDEDEGDEDEYGDVQDAGGDEPHSLQDPAFLWEAMQEHQREQVRQQQVYLERKNHHSCSHRHSGKDQVCPFQPPINPKLSRDLDAELAKSGLLPKGSGDFISSDPNGSSLSGAESKGGGSGDNNGDGVNPALCATCQCHACLKQSGHVVSTSLPLQVAASPSPADLHLYPHIHGLPQQDPKSYMFDLPHLMSSIKLPVKIDFDDPAGLQDHFYNTYSDWDSTMQPRPGSMAAQHQRLSVHNSDLLPPPPLDTATPPFTFDLASHLATHTTHTSTTNTTSAFKSVNGKHFASSLTPTLSNMGNITSEGSSVDPTKPLDFASLAKIPQSCLNGGVFPPASYTPSSTFSWVSSSIPTAAPVISTHTNSMSKVNGSCQGPPSSRPTPLGGNAASTTSKWEKTHPHCKKFTGGGGGHLSKPSSTGQHLQHNSAQRSSPGAGVGQAFSNAAIKNLFPSPQQQQQQQQHRDDGRAKSGNRIGTAYSSAPTPAPRPGGLSGQVADLMCSAPGQASNIGVGTATGPCNDPECDGHHGEENCDSVDDSCSEKSSSTTTSNQKEGKYCDCCYCEFFGHNNATTAKTSTNYIETKDRLQKKLKKRNERKHKPSPGKNGVKQPDVCEEVHDPLEKKGLEGLLRFINGDDAEAKGSEKELSAKAAKRARQKQKKLDQKTKLMNLFDPKNFPSNKSSEHPRECLQPELDVQSNMTKPKFKKPSVNAQKKEYHDDADVALKQEINRKSLIIESTRPTISVSKKEPEKQVSPSKVPSVRSEGREQSENMINILGALQSMNKTMGQVSTASPPGSKSQVMANCESPQNKNLNSAKASKENKVNGVHGGQRSKQASAQQPLVQSTAQQKTSQAKQPGQQQKQPLGQASKAANAKPVSAAQAGHSKSNGSPTGTNHLTSNGKVHPPAGTATPLVNGHSCKAESGSESSPAFASATMPSSKASSVMDSPSTGSGSSASQSPSCGTKAANDQGRANGKNKKKKKGKNNSINCVDEIFMPKSESELDADVDDFERELEEFKRFCFEPAEPKERRKIAVNVNLKDIFKKKTGLV